MPEEGGDGEAVRNEEQRERLGDPCGVIDDVNPESGVGSRTSMGSRTMRAARIVRCAAVGDIVDCDAQPDERSKRSDGVLFVTHCLADPRRTK